jgi:integrase
MGYKECGVTEFVWESCILICFIGLRTLGRGSEICALEWNDVDISKNDIIRIRFKKQKGNSVERWLPIEHPTKGFKYCAFIRKWIRKYSNGQQHRMSNFFSYQYKNGTTYVPLKITHISTWLKRMAIITGIQGNFSSHSLRIGGATKMIERGVPLEVIKTVGSWKSEAVFLYLRQVATLKHNISDLCTL